MFKKELTCIVCPRGCHLTVSREHEQGELMISGNGCQRGLDYGMNEILNPMRKVTSTVRIEGGIYKRLPVITDQAISKRQIFRVMDLLDAVSVKAPVKYGDIILPNVLETDVNIIASRSMDRL